MYTALRRMSLGCSRMGPALTIHRGFSRCHKCRRKSWVLFFSFFFVTIYPIIFLILIIWRKRAWEVSRRCADSVSWQNCSSLPFMSPSPSVSEPVVPRHPPSLTDCGSTGLQQACPEGVIVSLTPGDPSLWSGVMFVRKGPYANAVLRFYISFPDMYPRGPPLVTFSTDIFHPLITPLSNHAYAADLQDNAAAAGAASEEGRLPPGGFSLRHGFPAWFGGRRREEVVAAGPPRTPPRTGGSVASTPESRPTPAGETPGYMREGEEGVSTYDVLWYIRSVFDDDEVLDGVGVRAAGNPGAWYAWRTHRKAAGKAPEDGAASSGERAGAGAARDPGSWDWDGVWEDRVKKGIAASLSEPVLYGGASGADDVIRFQALEECDIETVKGNIIRTLGVSR